MMPSVLRSNDPKKDTALRVQGNPRAGVVVKALSVNAAEREHLEDELACCTREADSASASVPSSPAVQEMHESFEDLVHHGEGVARDRAARMHRSKSLHLVDLEDEASAALGFRYYFAAHGPSQMQLELCGLASTVSHISRAAH